MGMCPCFGSKKMSRQDSDHNKFPHRLPIEPKAEPLPASNRLDSLGKAQTFTYQELVLATNGFREESFIGQGGFGCVYRGKLQIGQAVAVKKLELSGLQGEKEFLVEVLMLSLLRHPNLVSMIGYCAEGVQRLLVYEYMPLGCLEDHLHDLPPGIEPLSWNMRLTIAAGAARGLDYLHQGDPPVIYRDLKTSNILLGDGFRPKLSDFGLAKFGPTGDRSHVSTRVMGTHGYCAPEYASSGKLTMKSDIYSFGVVLLELISGKRALDDSRGRADRYLVDWARPMLGNRKRFSELADPFVMGQYSSSVYNKFVEVASMCVRENAVTRPTSKDVVQALDYLVTLLQSPGEGEVYRYRAAVDSGHSSNNNSPQETTRMLKREEAVAEARMWGETKGGKLHNRDNISIQILATK